MKKILSFVRNNYSEIYKFALFLFVLVILVLLFPKNKQFRYEYYEGRPWLYENLVAPTDFPIQKTEDEKKQEIDHLNKSYKLYFKYNEDVTNSELQNLSSKFDSLWLQKYGYGNKNSYLENKDKVLKISSQILETGLIEIPKNIQQYKDDRIVYIIKNNVAKETFLNYFYTKKTGYSFCLEQLGDTSKIEANFILNFITNNIATNISYDSSKTETEKLLKISQISPNKGMVLAGQPIIYKGEVVDSDKFKILESLKYDFEKQSHKSNFGLYFGKIILMGIPLLAFGLFLLFFRQDIITENKNLILIFILIISMVAITRLVVIYNVSFALILPLMIVPIIIRAFYDSQLALIVHITIVILISFVVPDSFRFVFLQLMTGLITIISVVKLQKRSQFFFTALFIFISYSTIYIGIELISEANLSKLEPKIFGYFAISAGLTLMASPIIYIFERVFGMITDVSLLEYADINNSLIRRLSIQAPGTFHHSIQVSNLAEEAAIEIGANALLVRAGAMYHDIGKLKNPMFFIENQNGEYTPHDELSYEESSTLIINHVLDGIKIAKSYKLPSQIIDFIRTHHGTKRVEYFYRMHILNNPDEEVNLKNFTYHGPIPYSKETCILMMADAIEAATRSLKKIDSESISSVIDNIIKSQIDQNQYNNANISLREINTIKKVFKARLLNIYHLRIEYPDLK